MMTILLKIWKSLKLPTSLQLFAMRRVNDQFLIGVTGIIFNDQNEILLIKHSYRDNGKWSLPGGYIKGKEHPAGVRHVKRHSNVILDNCCVLTGVCWDDSLLAPIYGFMEYAEPQRAKYDNMDLRDLLSACFESLKNDLESEVEACNGDEYIEGEIEANGFRYTKEGNFFSL